MPGKSFSAHYAVALLDTSFDQIEIYLFPKRVACSDVAFANPPYVVVNVDTHGSPLLVGRRPGGPLSVPPASIAARWNMFTCSSSAARKAMCERGDCGSPAEIQKSPPGSSLPVSCTPNPAALSNSRQIL